MKKHFISGSKIITKRQGCFILLFLTVWFSGFSQDCPPADAGFSLADSCLVAGDSVQFLSNPLPGTTYLWNFGDGTSSTDANPVHVFSDYGYHCVSLTVDNACGTAQSSQILFVNPTDCPCNQTYDYPDGSQLTAAPPPGSTVTVEGDLFVPAGTNLSINDVTFQFAPKGRLIVMPDATLKASYTTFTALCIGTMWQGIEVWGNQGYSANDPSQGYLELGEQNKIEYAHIGVLVGGRNMQYPCYEVIFADKYITGGGKLLSIETTFKDDGTGIYFTKRIPATIHDHAYVIYKNVFISSHIIHPLPDGHYLYGSPNAYPYNPHNPWGQPATPLQRSHAGIYMEGQHEFYTLSDNKFTNMDYGIESYDSRFNITRSGFTNLYHGIYISNAYTSLYNSHKIYENNNAGNGYYFDSIPGNSYLMGDAIYIEGGQFDEIKDNQYGYAFLNPISTLVNDNGISLLNTSRFNIVHDNKFYYFKNGIKCLNSGTGGGYIGSALPFWISNTFTRCEHSIHTYGDNSFLKLKCNEFNFTGTGASPYQDCWYNHDGILSDQGSYPPPGTPQLFKRRYPAGNEFYDNYHKEINSDMQADIYDYFYHDPALSPSGDALVPTPNNYVDIHKVTGVGKLSGSCATVITPQPVISSTPLSVQPFTKLDSLQQVTQALELKLDSLKGVLDGGETQLLLDELQEHQPKWKIFGDLLSHSPLSDTVLIAAITRIPRFGPGMFTLLMIENLPVSRQVEPYLKSRIEHFPPFLKRLLLQLQGNNPLVTTVRGVERAIHFNRQLRTNLLSDILIQLTDSAVDRYNDAITLLEAENTPEATEILAATYLERDEPALAQTKIDALPEDAQAYRDFKTLYQILIDLRQQQKSIYEIDSLQLSVIGAIAHTCPATLAVSNARSLWKRLTREDIPECPPGSFGNKMEQLPVETVSKEPYETSDDDLLGENYPDPTDGNTVIPYRMPEGFEGYITVRNTTGQELFRYKALAGKHEIIINLDNYAAGSYYYSLEIKGLPVLTKKIIKK